MPRNRPLLLLLAIVLGVVLLALLTGEGAPRLPADADHAADLPEAGCLACHGHAAGRPRPAEHPLRDDCFSCHADAEGRRHPRPGAPTSIPGGWADDPRFQSPGAPRRTGRPGG